MNVNQTNGQWHTGKSFNVDDGYKKIYITGLNTGCGLAQLSGIAYSAQHKNFPKALKEASDHFKNDGVGAIICTLGQHFYNEIEPHLLKNGFKLLSEYNNYRHDKIGNYKQRLYLLTL